MKPLEAFIAKQIEKSLSGVITFAEFMRLALYHPQYGYYTVNRPKVGKKGDFFTSATIHPVFAETIADVVGEMLETVGGRTPALVEIGGGTGYLLKHLMHRLQATRPELVENMQVIIVEASPYHRELQRTALAEVGITPLWYQSVAEAAAAGPVEGVVFSNEWLDAYPVHLIENSDGRIREIGVAFDRKTGEFHEVPLPELSPEIAAFLQSEPLVLEPGLRVEVNLGMREAARDVAALLSRGTVITIDYGDEQEELHHPTRRRGTLMCYHQHHTHENPFLYIGEQDLTAHVNFTLFQKWGEEHGLIPHWFGRQDRFLIQSGILHKLMEHQDTDPFTSEAMKRNRAIQQLIQPGGMGGVFRVLVQTKGLAADTRFSFQENSTLIPPIG